jgi:predicted helicase
MLAHPPSASQTKATDHAVGGSQRAAVPSPVAVVTMNSMTESALEWVRDADADNTVEKGDRLERFVYLVGVPTLYPGATEVEWLGKGTDALGSGQDRADVAFTRQGERYFVQCKNYASPLGEGDADRYRTAFERRRNAGYTELVVVALGGFTTGAARSLLEVGATMFVFDGLADTDIELSEFFKLIAADRALTNPAPRSKTPLPHNSEAIAALCASTSTRNLVYRATGSGKTIVQAGVIAGTHAQRTIVFVPSIELVRQQLLSYAADLPDHQFLGEV